MFPSDLSQAGAKKIFLHINLAYRDFVGPRIKKNIHNHTHNSRFIPYDSP